MARAYSDDLRRRVLEAGDRGEGSARQLAQRFRVSEGFVEKIRGQRQRTGKMERVPHHPGRKPKFTEPICEQLRSWLRQQPDLTLPELQEKLRQEKQLQVAGSSLWTALRKMGWRLKKNRFTRRSGTPRPTASGGSSSWRRSAR